MKEYIPARAAKQVSSPEDRAYADAFRVLNEVVAKCINQEEAILLRLSTCRNAYLTANAIFVDLRFILGHGKTPSLLASAIELAKRSDLSGCWKIVKEIKFFLAQIDTKKQVWSRRDELDSVFAEQLKGLGNTDRDRVLDTLRKVRTGDPSLKQSWPSQYYDLSLEEPKNALVVMNSLDEAAIQISRMSKILDALPSIPDADDLLTLSEDPCPGWSKLSQALRTNSAVIKADTSSQEFLEFTDRSGTLLRVSAEFPGLDAGKRITDELLGLLEFAERSLYESISKGVLPNIARKPLPPPFEIVFKDQRPLGTKVPIGSPAVESIQLNFDRPSNIRVALPNFALPISFYAKDTKEFLSDTIRNRVSDVVEKAIRVAAANMVNVIVLPEYFLPADCLPRLRETVSETGVTLIAGIEGRTTKSERPLLKNEAVIMFPAHEQVYFQKKFRRSNMEPPLETTEDDPLFRFMNTPIGSFYVLVCADFREIDIVASIASTSSRFDLLFVPSFNPQFELFQVLGVSDACRLHCFVVISNNCPKNENDATSSGSVVCSPMNASVDRMRDDGDEHALGMMLSENSACSIRLYDLDLSAVAADSQKPISAKVLPVPHCRILSNQDPA